MQVFKIGFRKYIIQISDDITTKKVIEISDKISAKYPKHKFIFITGIE
jgi:hypothetical protein